MSVTTCLTDHAETIYWSRLGPTAEGSTTVLRPTFNCPQINNHGAKLGPSSPAHFAMEWVGLGAICINATVFWGFSSFAHLQPPQHFHFHSLWGGVGLTMLELSASANSYLKLPAVAKWRHWSAERFVTMFSFNLFLIGSVNSFPTHFRVETIWLVKYRPHIILQFLCKRTMLFSIS